VFEFFVECFKSQKTFSKQEVEAVTNWQGKSFSTYWSKQFKGLSNSAEILSILSKSFDFALALATGGLRVSAELKLRRADLLNPFIPIASSNDAVSREEIMHRSASSRREACDTIRTIHLCWRWCMGRQRQRETWVGGSSELAPASRRIAYVKLGPRWS
jgi:hypothetical protein